MNIQEMDIMKILHHTPYVNQRELAERSGYSLGLVNRCMKTLSQLGYLNEGAQLTAKALECLQAYAPQRAVILAAGYGMRMVPINTHTPKALLNVKGETLIERLIKQLHAVNIREIYVVVGFMKEQFEFLIDTYGVELVVNPNYASTNNLHSLSLVCDKLCNAYILPCDIWCRENPFCSEELYSWYMVKDCTTVESDVRVNRKMELVRIEKAAPGNPMVGVCYITKDDAPQLRHRLLALHADRAYDLCFWEEALYQKGKMGICARKVPENFSEEVNTYEQLRELDQQSDHLKSNAITTISRALTCQPKDITEIRVLKKGMTNRSFLFSCHGIRYIMRIPGEGTDQLINRREEAAVYQAIQSRNICDDVIYIDPDNGYKITRFLENARVCDPFDQKDVCNAMAFLRKFHQQEAAVSHEFDLFGKIAFYESLWNGIPSTYRDYDTTKRHVYSLKDYIDSHIEKKVLTHIDAVSDNFLFYPDEQGKEQIKLIDWEYAAMQDPHVDIAMFAIYALYNREQIDHLIDVYFDHACPMPTRIKIYCYVSVCGLLWSNWCEYKRNLGIEFGEYSLKQYRYAKEFYRYATEAMDTD